MKADVAAIEPFVRPNVRHGIDVRPVCALPFLVPYGTVDCVAGILSKTELIDMIAREPLPEDLPIPGNFQDQVILESAWRYLR